jgi:hypothetical protein
MKPLRIVYVAALALACGSVSAQQGENANLNSTTLRTRLDNFVHYADRHLTQTEVLDAIDGSSYVAGASDEAILAKRVCPTKPMSEMQMSLIVLNYLNAHPNEWDQPGLLLIDRALVQAYPCPTK